MENQICIGFLRKHAVEEKCNIKFLRYAMVMQSETWDSPYPIVLYSCTAKTLCSRYDYVDYCQYTPEICMTYPVTFDHVITHSTVSIRHLPYVIIYHSLLTPWWSKTFAESGPMMAFILPPEGHYISDGNGTFMP